MGECHYQGLFRNAASQATLGEGTDPLGARWTNHDLRHWRCGCLTVCRHLSHRSLAGYRGPAQTVWAGLAQLHGGGSGVTDSVELARLAIGRSSPMNELTNRDVKLIERIRDACGELDPVPDDVLSPRGANLKRSACKLTPPDGGSST